MPLTSTISDEEYIRQKNVRNSVLISRKIQTEQQQFRSTEVCLLWEQYAMTLNMICWESDAQDPDHSTAIPFLTRALMLTQPKSRVSLSNQYELMITPHNKHLNQVVLPITKQAVPRPVCTKL